MRLAPQVKILALGHKGGINLKVFEQLQLQISLGDKFTRKIRSKSLSRGLAGSPTPSSKCSKWT